MKNFTSKILAAFFLFTCSSETFCQGLYKVFSDEKIEQSSLIIEGKVISQKSFWNSQHTMIFTSNEVEVYKVFKGTTSTDRVEILTQGGTVGTRYIEASDLLKLSGNETGTFFCSSNTINLRSPETNNLLLDVYSSAQGFLNYDLGNNSADAPFVHYSDIKKIGRAHV